MGAALPGGPLGGEGWRGAWLCRARVGGDSPGPCRLVSHSLLVPRTAATGPGAASTCSFCRSALVLAAARLCVDPPPSPVRRREDLARHPAKNIVRGLKQAQKANHWIFKTALLFLGFGFVFSPKSFQ